jgi:hypothetical protein
LTPIQAKALKEFTEGQFSDGAGEGWAQQLWNEVEIKLNVRARDTHETAP